MKIELKDIPVREIIPGFYGKMIHTEKSTLSFWDVKEGTVLPEHSHPHEQTTQILEGKFQLTVDGEEMICEPGAIVIIPSNVLHSGKALAPCKIFDTFFPVREDYK
ncbi:MAG: cupin domain-containing protein [Leeuwenhoekiella sp.]